MEREARITRYVDQPARYGLLTIGEIFGIVAFAIIGFASIGGIGLVVGGLVGYVLVNKYSQGNKKGYLKKWLYFNFPAFKSGYKGLPRGSDRFFL